jgi:hypothetical protein
MASRFDVRHEHYMAALEVMAWHGWTLEQAKAHPIRGRALRALATKLAFAEYARSHAHENLLVRRNVAGTDRWITTVEKGARVVPQLIEED